MIFTLICQTNIKGGKVKRAGETNMNLIQSLHSPLMTNDKDDWLAGVNLFY